MCSTFVQIVADYAGRAKRSLARACLSRALRSAPAHFDAVFRARSPTKMESATTRPSKISSEKKCKTPPAPQHTNRNSISEFQGASLQFHSYARAPNELFFSGSATLVPKPQ